MLIFADMISNRDFCLRIAGPHSYGIKAGVPIRLPSTHFKTALAAGMQFVGADAAAQTEEVVAPKAAVEMPAWEMEDAIKKVFATVVARNDAEDFTATGAPKAAVISVALGTKVGQKLVTDLWNASKAVDTEFGA